MTTDLVLFTILACWTVLAALAVVCTQNIVRAAVSLLFTLIGVSLLYFLLGAEFLGASQLIVYVGGTLVLVIFGVMLTAQGPFVSLRTPGGEWLGAGVLAAILFALLVFTSLKIGDRSFGPGSPGRPGTKVREPAPGINVGVLGLAFMNVKEVAPATAVGNSRSQHGYLLPFEIVSVHLLVVLVGAAYLARAKRRARAAATPGAGELV